MADSHADSDDSGPRPKGGWTLWSALGYGAGAFIALYFGFFCLIMLDEFVMRRQMILEPLRSFSNPMADQFVEICRTIYYPLIWLVKQVTGIV